MAIAFKAEHEEKVLKWIAIIAIIILTLGLLFLNTGGAWEGSHGNFWFTLAVAGAEILTVPALALTILARTWPRRIAGGVITALLIIACLSNGEKAIHRSFSDVFVGDARQLEAQGQLAAEQATALAEQSQASQGMLREDLSLLREDIAKLEGEQELMTARSPEGIMAAQTLLQSKGLYDYVVDGKAEARTEAARREYGEKVQRQLESLRTQEANLRAQLSGGVVAATNDARLLQIERQAQAQTVREQTIWARFVLVAFESGRSLAVWALLMVTTATAVNRVRSAQDALAMAKANQEIASINAEIAALNPVKPPPAPEPEPAPVAEPEPVQAAPEPPPASPPEPVEEIPEPVAPAPPPEPELTDAQRRSRAGGLGAGQAKAAARAKNERLILVPSLVARDAELEAAKVAAE